MEKIVCITFFAAVLIAGCAVESTVSADQIWPDDKYMTRLEREVDELCTSFIEGITPGSMYIIWQDNFHPHSPLLTEAYVVSMFEQRLIEQGYIITTQEQDAHYTLSLIMTPHERSLLALAGINNNDMVIATREAYFTKGSEKWHRALSSHRYRTKTRISPGSTP